MKSASAEPGPRPTSCQPSASIFAVSRLCLSSERITSSVKSSMPQSVWWTTNHSSVPSSLWEITSEWMASSLAAGVADHVGVTFLEAGEFGGVEPRIHAGQNCEAPTGRQRKLALVAKIAGIGFIGSKDFVKNFRHDALLRAGSEAGCEIDARQRAPRRSSSALRVWQKRSRRASNRLARKALPRDKTV